MGLLTFVGRIVLVVLNIIFIVGSVFSLLVVCVFVKLFWHFVVEICL